MRYVIIGGSAAGISALEAIRSVDPTSPINIFTDEATPLFSRVLLPYYVAEQLSKPLLNFRAGDFFSVHNATAHLGVRVQKLLIDSKSVQTAEEKTYPFDALLLATGGKATIPPIPGIETQGIFTLKTMDDAERIYNFKAAKAVVLGAGSRGVEVSISLRKREMTVSLLEELGQVLPTVFDKEAAAIVRKRIEDTGVRVLTETRAQRVTGNGRVRAVVTKRGELECDMVILAVGVTPATELAQEAGIKIGPHGGIKVDHHLMTDVPGIYAAGDVAETYDIALGTDTVNAIWPCAFEQGRIAGLNMAGRKTPYAGSYRRNSIGNFIGIPAISMGVTHAGACPNRADGDDIREFRRRTKDAYRKLVLKNGKLVGAIFVGETQKAGIMSMLLKKQINVIEAIPLLMSSNLNFMDLLPLLRRNGDQFTEPEYKELMDTGL